ncbi:phenoloxidase-activating factor 2 [Drosophila subpulchrella]|uniref:phenoloxidase-activating factor 2 n=1 Tax=Drosophila subpulchrella TaxID=1486046 RepID=UPI0018A17E92|nr:phenoloxidase-activating factor 2 [Drosophila subpulchrella]
MFPVRTLIIFLSALILLGTAQDAEYDQSIENVVEDEQLKCGEGNPIPPELSFNITEGQAAPGEFPWTVAVLHHNKFLSGGSLIAPDVVLTTAHWIYNKMAEDLSVSAGEWDYGNSLKNYPFKQQNVTKIVIHKLFDYRRGANNLALLFLENEFQMTYRINTICLPTEKRSHTSTRCMVAGWGKKEFKDKHNTSILKKIDLPIVPRDICQDQLRHTRLGKDFTLPSGLICAGGEKGKDACTGDGGGALFCPMAEDPTRFEQIGIVNWGVGCNQRNVPATYTDVFEFKSWILNQLQGPMASPGSN